MVKSALFEDIHGIVLTKYRLVAIRLTNTSSCARCGEPDPIQHTTAECMEGRLIWTWTRAKLGMILRMDPRHIPSDWSIRPAFQYWPPQRQAALLRISAHLIYYRLQSSRHFSFKDLMIFLDQLGGRRITDHPNALTLAGTWTSSDAPPWCRRVRSDIPWDGTNRNAWHATALSLTTCLSPQSRSSCFLSFLCSYSGQEFATYVR